MNHYKIFGIKNTQLVTKCICHKGFSEHSNVVTRSNFRIVGQVTAPQSLTAHTLKRCKQCLPVFKTKSRARKNEKLLKKMINKEP